MPLRINQWCNVVRWEVKDVKPFLRSREFLWQEGHCVYETEKEAAKETVMMINEYKKLIEGLLAIPVLAGKKTEHEKFAGAKFTTTVEGFMPDGKALQMGTSHLLGQGFARAFNIRYLGKSELFEFPWQTSWGFSTRLIGAIVMAHGDDKGLVLPPQVAPITAVVVPIMAGDEELNKKILAKAKELSKKIKGKVIVDDRKEYTPGWKYNEWELKGVPLRIEIGPKDMEKSQAVFVRRDTGQKSFIPWAETATHSKQALLVMQQEMFIRAQQRMQAAFVEAHTFEEFLKLTTEQRKFVKIAFCGQEECEEAIKTKTNGVTSRVIPFELEHTRPQELCVACAKKAQSYVYFAKNY